jgi:hypothetical protein
MKKEAHISHHKKLLQFILGFFIGIALWGLTLLVLLILN